MKSNLLWLLFAILTTGCGTNCESEAKKYRTFDYNLRVESHYSKGRILSVKGIDLRDGNQHTYTDVGSWYPSFTKFMEDGDTVIKRKNELVFYIHKKDTVLSFPFTCEGEIIR